MLGGLGETLLLLLIVVLLELCCELLSLFKVSLLLKMLKERERAGRSQMDRVGRRAEGRSSCKDWMGRKEGGLCRGDEGSSRS